MKYKALYKIIYDDLKDAEMLIDYACKLKEEEPSIAQELAKNALERFNHFHQFHQLFMREAQKEIDVTNKNVTNCLWDVTHENYVEWASKIKAKIDKF